MKKRLQRLNKDILIVDGTGRNVMVYQGCTHIYTIEIFPLLETCLTDKTLLNKATRIDSLSESHGSNLTIQLNNGASRRMNMRLEINDFLVRSIMKVCKTIMPQKLYETLN
jgi:hypothetical protein